MSMPSTRHGPTSVPRSYSPACVIKTGQIFCVIVVPAFAGEAHSRVTESAASRLRLSRALRMATTTWQVLIFPLWAWNFCCLGPKTTWQDYLLEGWLRKHLRTAHGGSRWNWVETT